MKALVVCLVLVAAGVWAVLKFGGVLDHDPNAGLAEFKAVAVPGAAWEDVVEEMRPRAFQLYSSGAYGPEVGAEARWNRENFEGAIANGSTASGFVLAFQPSAGEAYDLYFDGAGKLESTVEPLTGKDFLHGTAVKKMQEQ